MGKCKRKIVAFVLFITMAMPILAKPTETYAASSKSSKIITLAKKQLGKKYVWAKSGPSSFDCSGFTYYVIKKTTGKTIPRSSTSQGKYGKYVSRKNLRKVCNGRTRRIHNRQVLCQGRPPRRRQRILHSCLLTAAAQNRPPRSPVRW